MTREQKNNSFFANEDTYISTYLHKHKIAIIVSIYFIYYTQITLCVCMESTSGQLKELIPPILNISILVNDTPTYDNGFVFRPIFTAAELKSLPRPMPNVIYKMHKKNLHSHSIIYQTIQLLLMPLHVSRKTWI